MGQRHQIYVAFRDYSKIRDPRKNKSGPITIKGFHHQWLYGGTAAMQALRMMMLADSMKIKQYWWMGDDYNPFWCSKTVNTTFQALYSYIPEYHYYDHICAVSPEECLNPLRGDNNDGITIFDFTDLENPKYCMMGIRNDGENSLESEMIAPAYRAFTAREYARFYYPDTPDAMWKKQSGAEAVKKLLKQLDEWSVELLDEKTSQYPLLREERVSELFPDMHKEIVALNS